MSMIAPTPLSLPIIDISPFLPASSETSHSSSIDLAARREATASAIHSACLNYGFFYITHHGLTAEEMQRPLEVAKEFFARPEKEKREIRIRQGDGARGYQLLGENVTQYKGWDAYCPVPSHLEDSTKLLHGPNLWPSEPTTFKPTMLDWVEKMKVLGLALLEATAMGLGVEMGKGGKVGAGETGQGQGGEGKEWTDLKALVEESFWVMRAIAYPPLPEGAEGISCGVHAVHTDPTPSSLQVFYPTPSGSSTERGRTGEWINADPVEGAFVVNIGEMWEIWSNNLYRATLHRVIHRSPNQRISLPFFSEPNFDAKIEPLPAALRMQERMGTARLEKKKEGVVYGDFLKAKVGGNFGFAKDEQEKEGDTQAD